MRYTNTHMPALDLRDLYVLLRNYRSVYCDDSKQIKHTEKLINDVKEVFSHEYPDLDINNLSMNIRNAGRNRIYDDDFDNRIISLVSQGKSYSQIKEITGCSRSYVSKLIKKHHTSN